jgi:sterol desaturase/sphingolipid hydroxylase (fatty acid hydroxylase superfamily)
MTRMTGSLASALRVYAGVVLAVTTTATIMYVGLCAAWVRWCADPEADAASLTRWPACYTGLVVCAQRALQAAMVAGLALCPWARRYRLPRPTHTQPTAAQTRALWLSTAANVVLSFPLALLVYGVLLEDGALRQPPPPAWVAALQFAACFVALDWGFYWCHRLLHAVPALYRGVHKHHHTFLAPTVLAAEYVTALELVFSVDAVMLGVCLGRGLMHPLVWAAWLVYRTLQSYEGHCGHQFPWSIHGALATHHDRHHEDGRSCFGATELWDRVHGTLRAADQE